MCRSLLAEDADGQAVLDYLGPVMADTLGSTEGESVASMGRGVYALFSRELAKWTTTGCTKLSKRYGEGLKYVESRLGIKGTQHDTPYDGAA